MPYIDHIIMNQKKKKKGLELRGAFTNNLKITQCDEHEKNNLYLLFFKKKKRKIKDRSWSVGDC